MSEPKKCFTEDCQNIPYLARNLWFADGTIQLIHLCKICRTAFDAGNQTGYLSERAVWREEKEQLSNQIDAMVKERNRLRGALEKISQKDDISHDTFRVCQQALNPPE